MRVLIIIMVLFLIAYVPLRWTAAAELRRHIGPKFLANYGIAMLVATYAPNALIYFVVLAVLFVATTEDRVDAACRYFLLISLLPNVEYYFTLGSVALFTLGNNDVLAISAIITAVARKRGDTKVAGSGGFRVEDWTIALVYLVFWLGANRITSFTVTGRAALEQALLIILPYVAIRRTLRTADDVRRALGCFAFAGVVLGVMALYESRQSWAMFDMVLDHLSTVTLNRSQFYRGGTMRASTTMAGPLALALHFVIAFITALYSREKVRSGLFYAAWLSMIFVGLLAAQSRGNMLCLVLAALIFFIVRGRWLYAALIGIAAPAAVGVLLILARSSAAVAGFLNITPGQSDGDVYDYRQLLLNRGLQEAAKHRWTGASMSDVMGRLSDIKQGEHIIDFVNTYLVIYLVSGLIGFVLVATAMLLVLQKLLKGVPRIAGQSLIDVRAFALTAYLIVLVQLSFMSFVDRVPIYLALALAVSRLVGVERERWRKLRPPPPPIDFDEDLAEIVRPAGPVALSPARA